MSIVFSALSPAAPRFDYGDRLRGMTNYYLAQGMGLVSAGKKYCVLYYRPEKIKEPYDDNTAKMVVFFTADGKPRWKSNGAAQGWRAYMQQGRNFVVYGDVPDQWEEASTDANKNIWDPYPVENSDQYNSPNTSAVFSSNTGEGGVPPLDYDLVVQDDGTLGIFPDGSPDLVWAAD